jgi:hypothetical protein
MSAFKNKREALDFVDALETAICARGVAWRGYALRALYSEVQYDEEDPWGEKAEHIGYACTVNPDESFTLDDARAVAREICLAPDDYFVTLEHVDRSNFATSDIVGPDVFKFVLSNGTAHEKMAALAAATA